MCMYCLFSVGVVKENKGNTIFVNIDYRVYVNALYITYLLIVYAIYHGALMIIINDIDNLTLAIFWFIPSCLQTNEAINN